jgi:hypothetical protein
MAGSPNGAYNNPGFLTFSNDNPGFLIGLIAISMYDGSSGPQNITDPAGDK